MSQSKWQLRFHPRWLAQNLCIFPIMLGYLSVQARRNIYSVECKSRLFYFISFIYFLINLFILFIYFWLHWVFVAAHGLSLVAASGGYSSLRCTGLSLRPLLLLRSTGSRRTGSVVVAHGLSCSAACGIFPDQGSNPCTLHWQTDS